LGHFVRDEQSLWPNYVAGVAQALAEAGYTPAGFDGLLHTTVPVASGLSSSAALEMAVGRMFEQVSGWQIDPVTLARVGQRAENHFVGVQTGILDQYTSALGKEGCAILLDARAVTSEDAPIAPGLHVVICDTRAGRSLASSEYGLRRAQCEAGVQALRARLPHVRALRDVTMEQFAAHAAALDPVVAKRCRFIIEENARVHALAAALTRGDRARIAALCAASFAGARDLYAITVPEMEAMLDAMRSGPGVVAARQAGAGFGGCMAAFVEEGAVDAFAAHVLQRYEAATGIEAKVYPVAASAGAGVL
jgi:galactokinase